MYPKPAGFFRSQSAFLPKSVGFSGVSWFFQKYSINKQTKTHTISTKLFEKLILFIDKTALGVIAEAIRIAPTLDPAKRIVVNISGRGDKDIFITSKAIASEEWSEFLSEEINRINTQKAV